MTLQEIAAEMLRLRQAADIDGDLINLRSVSTHAFIAFAANYAEELARGVIAEQEDHRKTLDSAERAADTLDEQNNAILVAASVLEKLATELDAWKERCAAWKERCAELEADSEIKYQYFVDSEAKDAEQSAEIKAWKERAERSIDVDILRDTSKHDECAFAMLREEIKAWKERAEKAEAVLNRLRANWRHDNDCAEVMDKLRPCDCFKRPVDAYFREGGK